VGTQRVEDDHDPVGAASGATEGIAAKAAPTGIAANAAPTGIAAEAARTIDRRWHSLDSDESVRTLESDLEQGLAHEDAAERLRRFGTNELAVEERRSILRIVIAQFTDFMILVLLGAAVISGLLGEFRDTLAIVVILVINATVGATQEFRAQRAVAALKKMAAPEARVVRGGRQLIVPAAALVPGDLVTLGAGDVVPADLRLIQSLSLHADESALTGESVPVSKHVAKLPDEDLALGDRRNMAFKQTSVTKGIGVGVVVATGLRTEIGRIAELLAERDDARTPLQRRLAIFGQRLALAVLAICALIFTLGVLTGQPPLLMFMTAVSLAVAAIPEALPAVITVALAIGAAKLAKQRSLVRRLPAVESLGSVTFICADKTGTLTENRMTLAVFAAAGKETADLATLAAPLRARVGAVLALCNDVSPADARSTDPTETALYQAARNSGFDKAAMLTQFPQIAVLAFDSDRRLMTTLHRRDGGAVALCKGAPEQVFARCASALDADGGVAAFDRASVEAVLDDLSGRGLRVLALAFRDLDALPRDDERDCVETELTLVGLVALHDPVRPEVPRAIAECRSAGITPIMITGDHPHTARNVGRELGIGDGEGEILTGRDLSELSDAALGERLRSTRIFARVNPEQKIRIVEVLQNSGEFVAMTGDGVNDAPALKHASIGIAMGQRGTEVARETADIVLLDDNFATIVAAVREGRRVYDNIRKFIKYAMTGNFGEILVLLLASVAGLPLPLLPIHILWVNLVTDGLPGLAFSAEPAEKDIMRRRPRHPRESVFAGGLLQHFVWVGFLIGSLSLLTALWADLGNLPHWQTMVFTTLVTAQIFHPLAIRSDRDSLFSIGLLSNRYLVGALGLTFAAQLLVVYTPFLNSWLRTTPLPLTDLLVSIGLGALVLPAVEIEKWLKRRRQS
jgi:Ca2+-transporting ATPase